MDNATNPTATQSGGRIIAQQIGQQAFFMLSAKGLVTDEANKALKFRIGRNSKGVTHVVISLDAGSDSYTGFAQ